jgi:hypothetical protein
MSATEEKSLLPQLAAFMRISPIPKTWTGIDAFLPFLEQMRKEGAVVLIKWDGERTGPHDTGPYTAAVLGAVMGEDFYRIDTHSMEDALASIVVYYAKLRWGFPGKEK